MQVFYDLALGLFLQSPGSNNEITQITAKRAANNAISLQFLNNGVPATVPAGTQFIFAGKAFQQYDNNYAVYVDPTGWTGPDANGFYNCNPGYNTVPLNQLFGYVDGQIDSNVHPDSVILDGEIDWLLPGATIWNKTPYFTIKCFNDVSKGIEGVPTSGQPAYPPPGTIVTTSSFVGTDTTAVISSGTTVLGCPAGIMRHKVNIGAGSYSAYLDLAAGTNAGSIARIPISLPGGAGVNVYLRDQRSQVVLSGFPLASGSSSLVYVEATWNGTAWENPDFTVGPASGGGGGSPVPGQIKTANFNITAYGRFPTDTSGGPITAQTPVAPSPGVFADVNDATESWGTNSLTIHYNGTDKINGGTADYVANGINGKLSLDYISSAYGWSIK